MCGIFGYLNYNVDRTKQDILSILVNGIHRMEYRGYDSSGLAVDGCNITKSNILETILIRKPGKVKELEKEIYLNKSHIQFQQNTKYHFGIAHTRWATHGEPSVINCHPQSSDPSNEFLVVHNGIITNNKSIREFLRKKGYSTISDTDTELIPVLFKYFWDKSSSDPDIKLSFLDITKLVVEQLEGTYALLVKSNHFPNESIATRRGSPLIVGVKVCNQHPMVRQTQQISESDIFSRHTKKSLTSCRSDSTIYDDQPIEYFIASDPCAIIEHTREVYYLEEFDIAHIDQKGRINFYNPGIEENITSAVDSCISEVKVITRTMKWLDFEMSQIMKGAFDTFMEKEIFEQPESLTNTLRGRINRETHEIVLGGLCAHAEIISRCKRLIFIACGTSYHSAIAVRQLMIEMTDVPIIVEIASDFLDRQVSIFRDDACIFISQSGETADTLGALRYCKRHQALLIGITNVVGSSISRETNCGIHINAGPEIGVASTKAYTSQIASLILMACWLGRDSVSKQKRILEITNSLKGLPAVIEKTLSCYNQIKEIAPTLQNYQSMLIVGRGFHVATCLEGALKIKELSYLHSEGILSGELKHGTLALIDENMPVIFILSKDSVYDKSMNALEQILSRKCRPIVLCDEECNFDDPRISTVIKVPHVIDCCQVICSVIPFQLLAMTLAKLRGHDVDCPRNLAKSVTVE